jgi:hypothetical protein
MSRTDVGFGKLAIIYYFAGAAISVSGILPQIPMHGKHMSLRI